MTGPTVLRNAGAIAIAAVAIGLLYQWLFVDTALGINAPIAVTALLVAAWLLRPASRPRPRARDAWLAGGAVLFSAFAAIRGDDTLVTLDLLGALALAGGALASFRGLAVVDRPFEGLVALGGRIALASMTAGAAVVQAARGAFPRARARSSMGRVAPVLRGLLIALPLVILFVALFAGADAVFARLVEDLFDWDIDLGSVPGRIAVAAASAWLAAGLLAFVTSGSVPEADATARIPRSPLRIGSAEATTVLVVLDLLFVAFVALQGAYLFGGQDTRAASGLTYADYARRGFFELLVVAFVVAGLILAAEAIVSRRTRAYLAAAIGLVALTAVVLLSALLRLRLYQEAYGWTELRFYVLAAIMWLAMGCVLAVVTLATGRSRWLLHGMIALSIVFGIAFNVIGPVRLVAEQNLARAIHPELVAAGGETSVDLWYLNLLGYDAVPPLADALPNLPADLQAEVRDILRLRANMLEHEPGTGSWQSWNLARESARSRLVR